jgi:hypothetical protein
MGCGLISGKISLYIKRVDGQDYQKFGLPTATSHCCGRWSPIGACRNDKSDLPKEDHMSERLQRTDFSTGIYRAAPRRVDVNVPHREDVTEYHFNILKW